MTVNEYLNFAAELKGIPKFSEKTRSRSPSNSPV
jgi:ABC-type multidrug transport system ATPase subunit